MAVVDLLLGTLEDLLEKDFKKFKWWLKNGGDFSPIPQSHLEKADEMDTVTKMIETYGEEMAVNVAVSVLKKMGNNNAADKLKNRYAAGGNTSAAAPPAAPVAPPPAPASIMAQQGSIIFAPNVSGSTTGPWTINIPK